MLMACSNLAGVEGESLLASQTLRAQQRAKLQTFTAASVHITIDLLLDEEQQLLNNLRAKYDIGASPRDLLAVLKEVESENEGEATHLERSCKGIALAIVEARTKAEVNFETDSKGAGFKAETIYQASAHDAEAAYAFTVDTYTKLSTPRTAEFKKIDASLVKATELLKQETDRHLLLKENKEARIADRKNEGKTEVRVLLEQHQVLKDRSQEEFETDIAAAQTSRNIADAQCASASKEGTEDIEADKLILSRGKDQIFALKECQTENGAHCDALRENLKNAASQLITDWSTPCVLGIVLSKEDFAAGDAICVAEKNAAVVAVGAKKKKCLGISEDTFKEISTKAQTKHDELQTLVKEQEATVKLSLASDIDVLERDIVVSEKPLARLEKDVEDKTEPRKVAKKQSEDAAYLLKTQTEQAALTKAAALKSAVAKQKTNKIKFENAANNLWAAAQVKYDNDLKGNEQLCQQDHAANKKELATVTLIREKVAKLEMVKDLQVSGGGEAGMNMHSKERDAALAGEVANHDPEYGNPAVQQRR